MFQELMPLLAERKVHILVSATSEGSLTLYIEPVKADDKEEAAFTTPFSVQATPKELDEQLPAILADWVGTRKQVCATLTEALEATKKELQRQAEEAKQKAKEKATKKPVAPVKASAGKVATATAAPKAAAVVGAAATTLLNGNGEAGEGNADGEDTQAGDGIAPGAASAATSNTDAAAPASVQAAAAVESGETVSLF